MPRLRTGHSFRTAVGKQKEVISRLKEIGSTFAPITDRASTYGWTTWTRAAKIAGLRPVLGVEIAVSADIGALKPSADFWTFVSRDTIKPINELVTLATSQFRYQPLLSTEQALAAAERVNVIIGHRAQLTEEQWAAPPDGAWLGLSPSCVKGYVGRALAAGWKPVAICDNYYPRPEDHAFYETLIGGFHSSTQTYPQHILSPAEWRDFVGTKLDLGREVLENAEWASTTILEASTAGLEKADLPIVPKPISLEEQCRRGAKLLKINLKKKVYRDRLARELALIKEKQFEDYFYIVADLCQWARNFMFVGPARGSSCGSLACYLLRITTVDPIPHGLIFERFIDVNRDDLPDIDIDFSDQQRSMVFEYLENKYGAERVARLGVVTTYLPRTALNETAGALRIPKWKTNAVVESLIERSSGDARALLTLEDTIRSTAPGQRLIKEHPGALIACRFEGHPRHTSSHAAGVVISREPILNYVAIDKRTGATHCDKYDAETLNLLKIDALGLTQLSVFEDALAMIGWEKDALENLPLDDKAAFEVLNRRHWSGVFQFNGMALQSLAKQFKVNSFQDIVNITALARPGPLASGGATEWIRRRQGQNPVDYAHPIFEPYLAETLGVVIYQEQVMEIGRNVGDLDWKQVTALRKAMSKSLGKEFFDQYGDPWKKGALSKGVDPSKVDKIWDDLCSYGSWSFNKSHSVAYGMISYWCLYLKAHYPHEFAAATLTHEINPVKQVHLLRELEHEGIGYIPVDPDHSGAKWTIKREGNRAWLVGPLQNVRGLGPKTLADIISARDNKMPLNDRARKLLENPTTKLDTLYPVRDAFARLLPDPATRNILTKPTSIGSIPLADERKNVLLFCTMAKIDPRDENETVKIAQRGGKVITDGQTKSLNLQLLDDTGQMFGKITRWNYEKLATEIIDRGRVGNAIYAIKGYVPPHRDKNDQFQMVIVEGVRYIGDIEVPKEKKKTKAEVEEEPTNIVAPEIEGSGTDDDEITVVRDVSGNSEEALAG